MSLVLAERQLNALEAAERSLNAADQRWAAHRRDTLERLADWLELEQKVEKLVKHAAPIHPGTGTDQSVHGRHGGTGFEVEYVSPIDHSHPVGDIPPQLARVLNTGAPIRERFREQFEEAVTKRREVLNAQYDEIRDRMHPLEQDLSAVNRRLSTSLERIAEFEAGRYKGPSLQDSILAHITDAENGDTISERLNSWRLMISGGEAQPIEIELTKAQYYNLSESAHRDFTDVDDELLIGGGYNGISGKFEIERLETRNGNTKGGILRIFDEDAHQKIIDRADWQAKDADYLGEIGKWRSWSSLRQKLKEAPPPLAAGGLQPNDTFWDIRLADGSEGIWDTPLGDPDWQGSPINERTFMAGEIAHARFLGEDWVDSDTGEEVLRSEGAISSKDLVDRILKDAEWAHRERKQIRSVLDPLKKSRKEIRLATRNAHRDFMADFLASEGIPTGTEIEVKRRAGAAKKLAADSRSLPAAWIEQYNTRHNGEGALSVHKKPGGGNYWRSKRGSGPGPHIDTDGSVDTNLHEIGHGLEKLPGIAPRVIEFFRYRTNNQGIRSRAVTNGRLYSDSFTDEYSGKRYQWGDHEILSNGIGGLFGGWRGMPDDEHLDFLFGLMKEASD